MEFRTNPFGSFVRNILPRSAPLAASISDYLSALVYGHKWFHLSDNEQILKGFARRRETFITDHWLSGHFRSFPDRISDVPKENDSKCAVFVWKLIIWKCTKLFSYIYGQDFITDGSQHAFLALIYVILFWRDNMGNLLNHKDRGRNQNRD